MGVHHSHTLLLKSMSMLKILDVLSKIMNRTQEDLLCLSYYEELKCIRIR